MTMIRRRRGGLALALAGGLADEPAGPGTDHPLLRADGTAAIAGSPPARLTLSVGAVVSDAGLVDARAGWERPRARWSVPVRLMDPGDAALVADLLRATRMGSLPTGWRSPTDPAPSGLTPVRTSPRYRLINAPALARRAGAHLADTAIELERDD
jgi:hypothetical protein